jgi:gliding motility-associated-like protein
MKFETAFFPLIKPLSRGRRILVLFALFQLLLATASAQLTANFNSDLTSTCAPGVVRFFDQSTGGPVTSWKWVLGNGSDTVRNVQNPVATYFNPGTYTVTLIVSNGTQESTVTKTNFITILAPPQVNYVADDTIGCFRHTVNFRDLTVVSSGSISSWYWDFGDGNFSTEQNPRHVYNLAGNYTVNLTVTQTNGCQQTYTKPWPYINVTPGVVANFLAPIASGCNPPVNVNLQNTTTGPGNISYAWDFGNATGSNQPSPTATYNAAGTYTIRLTATSDAGCFDSISKPVVIPSVSVRSSFNAPDSVCVGQTITFVNTSNPDPDSSFWNFGDGTTDRRVNPVKSFTTAGTYQVKMVNLFGSCVDSFVKAIVVLPPPAVTIASPNPGSCVSPHTVNFNANGTGITNWAWDFGDGATGSGQSVSHLYADTGTFSVRITVTNAQGCTNSQLFTNFVRISPPNIRVTNLPDSGCAPFTVTPNVQVNTQEAIASWFWDFGDGFTSTSSTPPSHSYAAPGTYRFLLRIVTASGCSDTLIIQDAVKVGTTPASLPDFTGAPLIACAGTPVNFTDLSPNPALISGWRWDFGDGGSSPDRNPVHTYADTGRFTVSLTIFNNGCGTAVTKTNYIQSTGAVARFGDTLYCTDRRTVYFSDSSINATSLLWNFGDGSPTTTVANPVHTFPGLGNYSVTLTASNGGCSFTETKIVKIIQEPATFILDPGSVCQGSRVVFTATGSNDVNIRNYDWDFGDGNFGSAPRQTSFNYNVNGLYRVGLQITDIYGCMDTSFQTLPVGGPTVGLGALNPTGCRGLLVNFIDSSRTDGINPIVTRIWDFGDGTPVQTINAPPYQHRYDSTGTFNVKLTVIDASGCSDSVTFVNFITTSDPRAAFVADSASSCPGTFIQFRNQTGGTINNFNWDFGDGNTSTDFSPIYAYNQIGQFTVKLKIRDRYGCEDSLTRVNYITIDTPFAAYTISDSISSCPPLNVQFTYQGRYAQQIRWEFGDGGVSDLINPLKVYNIPGVYTTRLIVTSPGGCTDTAEKTITIFGPSAIISYDPLGACDSLTVNFRSNNLRNVDSIVWDFDDGFVVTKDSTITHTYTQPGNYVPRVILQDATGCKVPLRGVDTIKIVELFPDFRSSTQLLCDRGLVQFTDSTVVVSNARKTSWLWDFGDGNTSTQQNPGHVYTAPGLYAVSLTVGTEFGCTETVTKTNFIRVVQSPVTDIAASADAICQQGLITFQGIETIPDTSVLRWSWNFSNGQVSNLQNPPAQQYLAPGTFTVQLVTTNSSGCTDTTNRAITIHPIPTVTASQDTTICLGQSVQLNVSGTNTYTWLPPAPGLTCTDCPNPVATPTVTTTYRVRGSSAFGCENTDSVRITVIQPSTVVAPPDDSLCIGENVVLRATGTQVYRWTPVTSLSNPNVPNPIARPSTTTTYTVTGSDFLGCFTTTDTVRVEVFALPTVDIGPDLTITAGTTDLQLNSVYSNDVVSLLWSPATGLSCTTCPNPIGAPRITTNYTLRVTNNGGCFATDALTVFVVCLNSNVFMPNTFSPNGDGMNEIFYPRGRGINTVRSLKVFTRWGQMIYSRDNFSANDPSAGWDGRFRGNQLPPDVYVYTISLVCDNQTIITLKGDVMLVR